MIKTVSDRYEGIIIDPSSLPHTKDELLSEIKHLIDSSQHKKLLWINVPIEKSESVPWLTAIGFEFHHCDEHSLMLVKKLVSNAFIPTTKNYIVGVGAVIISNNQLLVIKDRYYSGYKLPGGHIDKNELIKDAIKREVFEETGVHIEFESIMNLGHFQNGQFGESNLYIVCTAKALSKEIHINDSSEITEAIWMDVNDFLNNTDVNAYNKSVVNAAINNSQLKLTEQQVKLKVTTGEVFY